MTGHQQLDRQIDDIETTVNMLAFEISAGREKRVPVMLAVVDLKKAIHKIRGNQISSEE